MADKRLEANILLRYDRYARLMSSSIILQPGEAAVAAFPSTTAGDPPVAVGIKIGDGIHYFDELPWIQALAADVYAWAKDPDKPVYQATEIQGLAEYITAHTSGSGGGGGSGTASGGYRIIYDAASSTYILQQWNESIEDWENTASEINLADIINRITTIERWANGAITKLGNIEVPLTSYIYDEVINQLSKINYNDSAVEGQFVTSVSQEEGKISVTRAPINASHIEHGILSSEHGGTGFSFVDEDEVLVGSIDGNIIKKKFVTLIETDRGCFATTGAIIDYVTQQTAGLTGAMHFIGETAVIIDSGANNRANPLIRGYDFSQAQPGDVILANNAQEYVWTGNNWRLLGDEGSYAIKGSITNVDISEDAHISLSKLDGLLDALDLKVDKIDGKQLSTNDFNNDYKDKLTNIEAFAQVNLIEHILLNGTEVQPNAEKTVNLQIPVLTQEQLDLINNAEPNVIEHIFVNDTITPLEPTTINNLKKSVLIEFTPFTAEEKEKLRDIEAGAQVNKIESININGIQFEPTTGNKELSITLSPSIFQLTLLEGARYPQGNAYVDIDITNNKLELSKVAATGNITDLLQTSGTYITLNCGTSTEVMN